MTLVLVTNEPIGLQNALPLPILLCLLEAGVAFHPKRGIRRGEPILPYHLVLCRLPRKVIHFVSTREKSGRGIKLQKIVREFLT